MIIMTMIGYVGSHGTWTYMGNYTTCGKNCRPHRLFSAMRLAKLSTIPMSLDSSEPLNSLNPYIPWVWPPPSGK